MTQTKQTAAGAPDSDPSDSDAAASGLPNDPEHFLATRPWMQRTGDQLVGRGHRAGDLLEAYTWQIQHEAPGRLEVRARLHDGLLNPNGHLFGGFTGTIVDFISLLTIRAPLAEPSHLGWLATVNLHVNYLAPVWGPEFRITGDVTHRRGRRFLTTVRFFDLDDEHLVHALTTMIERPR